MTSQIRNAGIGTKFGAWLRQQPELDPCRAKLSIQNLDYIVHRYEYKIANWQLMMLLEEKTFRAPQSWAQIDTHSILDQVLTHSDGIEIHTARGQKILRYCGYHILRFERHTPDDGAMWWNDKLIDRETLVHALRFDIDPQKIQAVRL